MPNKTKESMKYWYRGFCNVAITVIATAEFAWVWGRYLNVLLYREYLNKGNLLMILVYSVLTILFLCVFAGYKIGVSRISNLILSQGLSIVCLNAVEIMLTILMVGKVHDIGTICTAYIRLAVAQILTMAICSVAMTFLYRKIFPPYRMLHIYGQYPNHLAGKMNARGDKYVIAGEMNCNAGLEQIDKAMELYDAVLINDVPSGLRNKILKLCFSRKKRVYFTPKISDIIIKSSDELKLFDTPVYFCRNLGMSLPQQVAKRAGDVLISCIGIVITSPVMAAAAIAVHFYDGGPALYRQTRCTIDGREFEILKFRSMVMNAEEDGQARLATENDRRITPVGKVIRATRIDELPQFFNILKGDMSVVGPRPERPEINRKYCEEVPEFAYRLHVKAGLTGYAQVFGKYNTTSYDKLKLDMIYVQNCSLLLDIQLILLTLKVIFQRESTEGLEDGNTTASTRNLTK